MEWLNYHHLHYFWSVARAGSIAKASKELLLSPPTISAQINRLENDLDEKLFERSGRRLVLSDMGRVVFRYADEIFSLGKELTDTLKGRPTGHPLRLALGIADIFPKVIVKELIEPAFHLGRPIRVICREDPPDRLLALLALQVLDAVITDVPISAGIKVKTFSHLLRESGITFVAERKLALAHSRGFPKSLNGAPMLLPSDNTAIRRDLDRWLESQGVQVEVIGEFEDASLLAEFGKSGLGILPIPSILMSSRGRISGLHAVGSTVEIRSRIYAVSIERRVKHPAVAAICESAGAKLIPHNL
jgi:LysR family transcriptional regulator, transcriptional activator of nhaA